MIITRHLFFSLSAIAVLVVGGPSANAIVRGHEPDASDTRFDAVAAFGATRNLAGGDAVNRTFGNGTLIHPRMTVIARHLLPFTDRNGNNYFSPDYDEPPPGTYTQRFRRHADGSLGTKEAGWESFHQVRIMDYIFPNNTSDVAIGILEDPVTHINPLPVKMGGLQVGDEVIISGWGKEGPGFNEGPRGRLLLANKTLTHVHETQTSLTFLTADFTADGEEPGPNNFDSGGGILWEDTGGQVHFPGVISATSGGTNFGQFTIADAFFASLLTDLDGVRGDFNGDGEVDTLDLPEFEDALTAPDAWVSLHPEGLGAHILGDFNEDGFLTEDDVSGFMAAIPEPSQAAGVLGAAALLSLLARRRVPQ